MRGKMWTQNLIEQFSLYSIYGRYVKLCFCHHFPPDHRRYAVFCLVKIGTEIFDTELVKDVDRSMTDVTFDDTIIL